MILRDKIFILFVLFAGYGIIIYPTLALPNWTYLSFISSGNWSVPSNIKTFDVFLVGGGAGGFEGAGGGGYTINQYSISVISGDSFIITVGAGGPAYSGNMKGSRSRIENITINYNANGGIAPAGDGKGSNGGSGGAGFPSKHTHTTGGINGGNGQTGSYAGGIGQGSTTYAFQDSSLTLYSNGGNSYYNYNPQHCGVTKTPNTGDGGDGAYYTGFSYCPSDGATGIVIIRYEIVSSALPPVADFSCSPLITYLNFTISCSDLSINSPTSWNWYSSNNKHPLIIGNLSNQNSLLFPKNIGGWYDVCLIATNGAGSSTKCSGDKYIWVSKSWI